MDEKQQVDVIYFVYHDEISLEKSKIVMELCSQAIMQFSPKTIYFQISSGGGSVDSAITLYNFLKSLPCEIIMHNIGSIDSAANVVFMAGDKCYAAAHTSFLFHGVTYGFGGNVSKSQITEGLSIVEIAETKIAGILAKHSQLTEREVKDLFVVGESKSATFAKEKGIISDLRDAEVPAGAPIYTINAHANS